MQGGKSEEEDDDPDEEFDSTVVERSVRKSMNGVLDRLKKDLSRIRTGKPTPGELPLV